MVFVTLFFAIAVIKKNVPILDGPAVHNNTSVNPSNTNNVAPPPYSDSPPPYDVVGTPTMPVQPPPPGVMGEPTVVCRVCQQLIFIRGREGQRVVKCSNCHEATVSKVPKSLFT